MPLLTWEMFLDLAKKFLKTSNKLGDTWTLEGNSEEMGLKYLKKTITERISNDIPLDQSEILNNYMEEQIVIISKQSNILRWEYHVYFSLSYNVPVLCFNVWNETGHLLKLEEVWEHCQLRCDVPVPDLYSALTQQDHPVLLRPFFTVHPCKTAEILNITVNEDEGNPIIRFLSAIGPLVKLKMDIGYAFQY